MSLLSTLLLTSSLAASLRTPIQPQDERQILTSFPLLVTHYMPWFEADPVQHKWGWHWTMNHFNPDKKVDGVREIASKYHPLIGPYDNGDPNVIAYHVMLMKLSGIDGVLIDWYGTDNYVDYGGIQQRTLKLIDEIKKAHLQYGIVYEDQTIPRLTSGGVFNKEQTESHINAMFKWMDKTWFHDPNYLHINGMPVLLVFGPQYFKDDQWSRLFEGVSPEPAFFTLMNRRGPAIGAFGWPAPQGGDAGSQRSVDQFYQDARKWKAFIPAAFPRFDDIYQQAGVSPSWGHISDDQDQLYRQLLDRGIRSRAPMVQLVTWNDWGEGTVLEPSKEIGFKSLETTQGSRKQLIDTKFRFTPEDLRIALRWYQLHKQIAPAQTAKLNSVPQLVYTGKLAEARTILDSLGAR